MVLFRVNYESDICNDFIKCFICFEDFKLLKCFLCFYLFCYECLKNYIEFLCFLKELFVGFFCFFCWDFILVENILVELKDWVNDFLINDKFGNIF